MEYGQQGQHGHGTTDRVDQYGTGGGAGAGTGGMGLGGERASMGGQQFQPAREEHKTGGILHRSGSSSSSSSEDDGMGGRRKKGLKDKIKEKMPGGHKNEQQGQTGMTGDAYGHQGNTGMTSTGGAYGTEDTGGKKGIMDKIKEKIPGQH